MAFNNQGELFIALGDAGINPRKAYHPTQDMQSMLGKVLRIVPTESGYTIPADTPFLVQAGIPPEIYSVGFRNPFRMVHRAADNALFVGNVGQDVWEELNRLNSGQNYGWPLREGPCPRGRRLPCDEAPEFANPVMYFEHPADEGCCEGGAITGMAFYEGSTFPTDYHGKLFVADFNGRTIAVIEPDTAGLFDGPHFAEGIGLVTDIEYANEQLYLLDIRSGSVSRISYYGDDHRPIVALRADITLGAAPLRVQLDASQSNSAQDRQLTYEWQIGSSSSVTTGITITTAPTLAHTFTEDGDDLIELVTIDSEMRRSPTATLSVNVQQFPQPRSCAEK